MLSSGQILFWLLISLIGSVTVTRLHLHIFGVRHVYIRGHIFRHLFMGTLLVIPAGFTLAFGLHHAWSMIITLIIFGIGSGLILDEIVYLMATNRTDSDYLSTPSLKGALWFSVIGIITLLLIYLLLK